MQTCCVLDNVCMQGALLQVVVGQHMYDIKHSAQGRLLCSMVMIMCLTLF